jgi:predicted RNase H-like HicB family nuclease
LQVGEAIMYFIQFKNCDRSFFGDTPQEALEELKTAWELVKEDYKLQNREIPVASNREKIAN